ncbi:aminotransferase class I/II-fold pyridoxal phosphate-dependent enzyme [Ferrimicrobium sp.]|jgi:histidinol-phosphate aminotransferase|uniref:pyridoxal phosphate-dependent aminotransferase n=1 Tax=Ferrimicrobium sp. TaxID=2926050 RepID=UPI00261AB6E0|nr:aminotransferase class I/II-fold pyridoxal phosphate-dependent enzyme [Ferrimicrobium sp.]
MMITPSLAEVLASSYHSPQLDVEVRLNTNESPIAPPTGFLEEVGRRVVASSLNRYPDRQAHELRRRLGELHGVGPESVFVGNGSNEVLQTIFLTYGGPGRSVWIASPTYGMYAQIAATTRTEVHDGQRSESGAIEADTIDRDSTIVVICDPNNPTGAVEPETLRQVPSQRTEQLFVIDRAYHDFDTRDIPEWSGDNVVVVRTFSKAVSLAGLRMGYCVAGPDVVHALYGAILPYHLSSLTQLVALTALDWYQELTRAAALVVSERDILTSRLVKLGLEPYPSATNFVLVSMGRYDAHSIWEQLVRRSVLVRDASRWPGVTNALRITVGTPEENARAVDALADILTKEVPC